MVISIEPPRYLPPRSMDNDCGPRWRCVKHLYQTWTFPAASSCNFLSSIHRSIICVRGSWRGQLHTILDINNNFNLNLLLSLFCTKAKLIATKTLGQVTAEILKLILFKFIV